MVKSRPHEVRTSQGRIVFDAVVEVEVSQIESVLVVIFLQHMGSQVGHKEGEAGCEVVGSVEFVRHVTKFNVFAVMGDDAWPEN